MSLFPLKPSRKPVKDYYAALAQFQLHTTEGNTRSAFADLLKRCCPPYGWHLVEEYAFKGTASNPSAPTEPSSTTSPSSTASGKRKTPTTTSTPRSRKSSPADTLSPTSSSSPPPTPSSTRAAANPSTAPSQSPEALIEILELFFEHRQAHELDWEEAVDKFAEKIPDLARGVTAILEKETKESRLPRKLPVLRRTLPPVHQPRPHLRRHPQDARPAPPHRAHLPQGLQQPGIPLSAT